MAPKVRPKDPIPGLGSKGGLKEFHTGIVWGLANAHKYSGGEKLTQRAVSELMGCTERTARLHLRKGDEYLEEAVRLLKEKQGPRKARTETEAPEPVDVTPDQQERLKYLSRALDRREFHTGIVWGWISGSIVRS